MKPWLKALCAAMLALGIVVAAAYVSGVLVLWSLGLSLAQLRIDLIYNTLWVLDRPDLQPVATRIRVWTLIGVAVPVVLGGGLGAWCRRWQRANWPTPVPPFARLGDGARWWSYRRGRGIALASRWGRSTSAPDASVLVVGRRAPASLVTTLRHVQGPVLVIDPGGHLYAETAGWRAKDGHPVLQIALFGGCHGWNPLQPAWTKDGWSDPALRAIAACWYPRHAQRNALLASQVQHAFVALVHVVHDVLHAAGEGETRVSPVDLFRLCRWHANHRSLAALASHPALSSATRIALGEWRGLDQATIARIWQELRGPLEPFASWNPDRDAIARHGDLCGGHDPRRVTIYLDIPGDRGEEARPLIETFVNQWQARVAYRAPKVKPLVILNSLRTFPPLACLTEGPQALRWLVSTAGLDTLPGLYGKATTALLRRFDLCVVQPPPERDWAEAQAPVCDAFIRAHAPDKHRLTCLSPCADDLMTLRRGEQAVMVPSGHRAVRCAIPRPPRRRLPPPPELQGDLMPVPLPIGMLIAALLAACRSLPPTAPEPTAYNPCHAQPSVTTKTLTLREACLGPHRFRLPSNLYDGQRGQDNDIDTIYMSIQWPSLQPLPMGIDQHDDPHTFLSSITINASYLSRIADEDYPRHLWKTIQPLNPSDPEQRADPSENLDLRIKGKPLYGLIPYYADFDRLKTYYRKVYGPDTRAHEPDVNDDWFVRFDPEGVPTTVIICSSRRLPNGVHLERDQLVDDIARDGSRALCRHKFLIPEYKVYVSMHYMRVLMPHWEQIEASVRALLKNGEIQ
ncbi:hypothetical protein FHW69_002692 [Luteibacter sp. Sphag1AF]|uniref:hypothetical protein n=1 Tax=Luteibacter sp. Sphag1AF TaxID=2587031 RepID=UPI00160A6113|nr:hypothetical protein [Luteibacter sp. Sphag1AF]MBB3228057.1 hypothetical protein [Luteibacter sp. Sphag1AF]